MYQLGTKWKLWDLQSLMQDKVQAITLRGYRKNAPVILPADFYMTSVDEEGNFKSLSVEKIASRYCPTRRDLYLEKKLGARGIPGQRTWGRVAGHLIEEYCKGLLQHFSRLAQEPKGLNYEEIHSLADGYSKAFWETHAKKLQELQDKAGNPEETPEHLVFLLQQTAKYELTMLGIDYAFSQYDGAAFVPLMQRIPIAFDRGEVEISPAATLGLSQPTTPDFVILQPEIVMGDVKTGIELKDFHLHTVAGYALAYESQYSQDVDFGVVYFFGTHTKQMSFAQSYVFVIDDFLRRKFLDARDEAYSVIQQDEAPSLADDYEKHCKYCKHLEDCYPATEPSAPRCWRWIANIASVLRAATERIQD